MRQLTIGLCTALLVAGFSETLIFAITSDGLHRRTSFIGVIATFQGIGSILGGITAARLMRRVGDLKLAGIGIALFGVGDCLWLIANETVVLAATAVAGLGIVWAIVALATSYQRRSPSQMQGRVSAAANMLFSVPQTISIAAGAALITLVDYRVEIVAMAVVFLIAAVYLLTRGDEVVRLTPKATDLLLALLEADGRVVSFITCPTIAEHPFLAAVGLDLAGVRRSASITGSSSDSSLSAVCVVGAAR